jgi:hypothetical protein
MRPAPTARMIAAGLLTAGAVTATAAPASAQAPDCPEGKVSVT